MTKSLLMLSFSAFLLFSCGGNQQQNQTSTTKSEETAQNQQPYKFVEPTENIAQKIWNAAKASNPEIKPVIDEAVEIEWISQDEATNFVSNTFMTYEYIIPQGTEEPDNLLSAQYSLKCYQKIDKEWIAMVTKYVHGYAGEDSIYSVKKIFLVNQNGENIDAGNIFPPQLKPFEKYYTDNYDKNFDFSNEGFTFKSYKYWNVDFVWNGEKFMLKENTPVVENRIDKFGGFYVTRNERSYRLGDEFSEKELKEDGEIIATFDLEGSVIKGYTVKSPKCGFAQTTDTENGFYFISSKPVAVGFPIKNVLDYKKGYEMKDTLIRETEKDGKYVITQQLNTDYKLKTDIIIEFTAKDKNSEIEQIRVYGVKNNATLKAELAKSQLSAKNKEFFAALDMLKPGETENREGSFLKSNGFTDDDFEKLMSEENGFAAYYKNDKSFYFQVYPTKNEGCCYAYFFSMKDFKIVKTLAWYNEQGRIDETDANFSIPKAQDYPAWNINYTYFNGDCDHTIKADDYSFNLSNYTGIISFYASSDRNDGSAEMRDDSGEFKNIDEYKVEYKWNLSAEKFVKQ
ncbi:MAG: hypothetical protein II956_03890 [Bacteroidales bacterium]|nr:hypothetical protein [Bacteroidales bacterium]